MSNAQRPLNLLYLVRTWDPGGSHTIIRALLRHLPRDRFNITTVIYDAPGDGDARFAELVRKDGGEVAPERIPWRSRRNWREARSTVRGLIQKYAIDCVHCHDTHSNVLVGLGRRSFPCAAVASPYGWWEPDGRLRPKIYHWIEKNLALPRFDLVYTVSSDMKHKVLQGRTREERIRVIHTGIDTARLDGGAPRAAVRAAFGLAEEHLVAGTVSRLFVEKGHRYLIDALARLRERVPELRLLIVGTGDQRAALEEQARALHLEQRVVFTGYHEDLAGALGAIDLFIQPSIDHEGFPTAVLEAEAAGLPVIASDIGGTRETIQINETGLLVPPRDPAALADAIEVLARDPARRRAMGAEARRWVRGSLTLEDMMRQMTALYDDAMALHRGGTP